MNAALFWVVAACCSGAVAAIVVDLLAWRRPTPLRRATAAEIADRLAAGTLTEAEVAEEFERRGLGVTQAGRDAVVRDRAVRAALPHLQGPTDTDALAGYVLHYLVEQGRAALDVEEPVVAPRRSSTARETAAAWIAKQPPAVRARIRDSGAPVALFSGLEPLDD